MLREEELLGFSQGRRAVNDGRGDPAPPLHGERAKLDELRRTDEFEHFSISLLRFFEGYGVVPGLNGEALDKAMARNRDLMK